ncbi:MAG: hypothetical protein U0325_09835 [Polyangiales bacterium]
MPWIPRGAREDSGGAPSLSVRGGSGKQGLCLRDTNLAVVPHEGEVRRFERGWFGRLQGDAWPGDGCR